MKNVIRISMLFILPCVIGCGVDGDDQSSSPPVYSGSTAAAIITSNNAQTLAAGALNGADMAISIEAPAAASTDQRQVSVASFPSDNKLIDVLVSLKRTGEKYNSDSVKAASSTLKIKAPAAITTRSGSIPGECGGSVSYTLTINDQTGSFAGTFAFGSYCDGGTQISGSCAVNGIYALLTDEFETLNMELVDMTTGGYSTRGTVSIDYRGYPPTIVMSSDLLTLKTSTGIRYWVNDYIFSVIETQTGYTINVAGRYYDPAHGYVDVSTITPFNLDLNAAWPKAGTLLCSGSNSSATITALDEESYLIKADRNGDGVHEYQIGPFYWSEF